MDELLKKIPVSIIALCVAVLTILISFAVFRGDSTIDVWGIKIDPKGVSQPASTQEAPVATFPVGSVLASYLAPHQMQEKYGEQWVLADGREVSTTTKFYDITGKTKVPDLRGMFIRGLNVDRKDGKQDPEGHDRLVGDYQADAFQKHNHAIRTAGIWGRSFKGENGSPKTAYEKSEETGDRGGTETRAKNIALYYYIKIS
jgi:hypothetical protein